MATLRWFRGALVIPALATYTVRRRRLAKAYAVGALGYAAGLVASAAADLPSGAMIVCAMAAAGIGAALLERAGAAAQPG